MRLGLVNGLVVLSLCLSGHLAVAGEPNNDFFSATVLEPGQVSVADEIVTTLADTLLGERLLFGGVGEVDDDDSPRGNGLASAIYDVPISNGEVSFSVSGVGDDSFVGDHGESGFFEAFVTVYDFFGDQIDLFSFEDELFPGEANDYSFSDFNYFNGSYDVELDNTAGLNGDVDFFTFTGLTPGDMFTAEVLDPDEFFLDSILGWFDETGTLIESNNDISFSDLRSSLGGTVPANGELTFAVTAFNDVDFVGDHFGDWTYELQLGIVPNETGFADANGDGVVDLLDLDILGANFGLTGGATIAQGDFNGDGNVDLLDLDILGQDFGSTASSVPEPASVCLAGLAMAMAFRRR